MGVRSEKVDLTSFLIVKHPKAIVNELMTVVTGQQLQNLIPVDQDAADSLSGENLFGQVLLTLMKILDLLFDGVFRDQFVNGYGVFLADAVRTVGCLVLGCHRSTTDRSG